MCRLRGIFFTFVAVIQVEMVRRWWRYFRQANTKYQVHSPFVFEFIEDVLEDERNYYAFGIIRTLRERLRESDRMIEVHDLGAGSTVQNGKVRSLRSIIDSAVSSEWQGKVLFRTIVKYKPQTMLELGTSVGITTLYQAKAMSKSKMVTLEGCPELSKVARKNFALMQATNVEVITGNFDQTLPQAVRVLKKLDYVFFDGNHRKEPTLRYFNWCLTYSHPYSIFVFDDIHWSDEMEAAWDEIKRHPKVTMTIDLFYFGLVFFRPEFRTTEHHTIIETQRKPWEMGFFTKNTHQPKK